MGCGVLRNLAASNSEQQQAVVSRGGVQARLISNFVHGACMIAVYYNTLKLFSKRSSGFVM